MLAALDRLEDHGYALGARRVDLLATEPRAALADRIAANRRAVYVASGAGAQLMAFRFRVG